MHKMNGRTHKIDIIERKIWDSELCRIDETVKNYQSRGERNAYCLGYKDALRFLMESYEILEHSSDAHFLNSLDDSD